MLHCLSLRSSSSSPSTANSNPPLPPQQANLGAAGNSREDTPRSSSHPSPTVNVTREYTFAVQTSSYNEIWSKIQVPVSQPEQGEFHECDDDGARELRLAEVLQPNRECVQDALRSACPNTLTRLVSAYFDHSEGTSYLCLLLHHSVHRARSMYRPLHDLLDVLPLDCLSLTQPQCDQACDVFLQFDRLDNPFPCPDSHNFHDMRRCFSQLKQQLDHRLQKSRSRIRFLRHCTTGFALCFIGTAVGAAAAAVAIASHSLVALVACPVFSAFLPSKLTKKELAHIAQLDAAARGTYVLNNDLDTIDRLVVRLHTAVEADKLLVRLGLERGRERYPVQEVAKQLRKNHNNFLHQLKDLEEHICLCFATVNRARSLLLQEIHLCEIYSS